MNARILHSRTARRRGITLLELVISITVLAILSVGATNLLLGALRTDRVLLDSNRQVSEIELAIRRLTHNIRTGSGITLTGSTSLTLVTQADPNNNGQTYSVTYTYDSSAKTLTETSTQFASTANVIAYDVTAFSFTQVTSSPLVISIDITIQGSRAAAATRRTFQVYNRNS